MLCEFPLNLLSYTVQREQIIHFFLYHSGLNNTFPCSVITTTVRSSPPIALKFISFGLLIVSIFAPPIIRSYHFPILSYAVFAKKQPETPVKSRGLTILPKNRKHRRTFLQHTKKISFFFTGVLRMVTGKTSKTVRLYILKPHFKRVLWSYQASYQKYSGKTFNQTAVPSVHLQYPPPA